VPSVGVPRADLDDLMRVVGSFAQFRELDALRQHTVGVLAGLMPNNAVAWNEVDTERGRIVAVVEPDLYSEEAAETFMAHIGEHPLVNRFNATGDGRPYAISDFLSAAAFHATGLYQHFYRVFEAEDQIAFILPEPRFMIGIALNRPRRGFTRRERQVLNALRPHLIQAYRNAEDFSRLQRSVTAMQMLVEQAGDGLVLIDRHGFPDFCSERAQDMLERWFGPMNPGRLPEPVAGWFGPSGHMTAPPTPLHLNRGDARLMVRRVPVPGGQALLVSETRSDQTAMLLRRLGLTDREVQVLLMLTSGHTVASAAARLGVSPRTVEKHVEHIYDKLGLDGRVAATNLVRQLEHQRA
jgi:DNA-binding CsgD family transcriptional regulator/PAS domain-containing protein